MPKVHELKARKDYPDEGISKGDTYYKWSIKTGPASGFTRKSKTRPKPSQLTQSEFWSGIYGIQEDAEDVPEFDDIQDSLDDLKSRVEELRDEMQSRFDNMPDGLQQGDTGQLLEERASALEEIVGELENVNVPDEDEIKQDLDVTDDETLTDEEKKDALEEALENLKVEKAAEVWQEVQDALSNISCS